MCLENCDMIKQCNCWIHESVCENNHFSHYDLHEKKMVPGQGHSYCPYSKRSEESMKIPELKRQTHKECPLCDAPTVRKCNCTAYCGECENGHSWYMKGGVKTVGYYNHRGPNP